MHEERMILLEPSFDPGNAQARQSLRRGRHPSEL
jgi:hypothetical protein